MKKIMMIVILGVLGYSLALAKDESVKKTSHKVLESKLNFTFVYGDKISNFVLKESKGIKYLTFSSSFEPYREVALRPGELDYILKKIQSIPHRIEKEENCGRLYASLNSTIGAQSYRSVACLKGTTPTAKGLLELANTLSFIVQK